MIKETRMNEEYEDAASKYFKADKRPTIAETRRTVGSGTFALRHSSPRSTN